MWEIATKSCENDIQAKTVITKETHRLIKEVNYRIENFKFNTAISAFMTYSNVIIKEAAAGIDKDNLEKFLILFAPFAPHFAEEIWYRLGYENSIFETGNWPEFNPDLIKKDTIEIPVQVNGRVREIIEIEKESKKEEILSEVKELEKIRKYIKGKEVIKEIYVPEKVVNFVTK